MNAGLSTERPEKSGELNPAKALGDERGESIDTTSR
jgi:hypothetical protein